MDEKDLNENGKENQLQNDAEETNGTGKVEPDKAVDLNDFTEDKNDEWSFDGKVHTDLSEMDLKYSGQEIVIEDVETKKEKQEDVITIDKTKIRKIFKIVGISLLSLIVALALAFGVFFSFFAPNTLEINTPINTALKVDGKSISVGEYNYYYATITSSDKMEQYAQYMGLDTTKSYDDQYYDQEKKQTWTDYFEQATIDQIKYITALSQKAKDGKVKLTAEQEKSIKTEMDAIKTQAATAGLSTTAYLAKNYGENIGTKTVKNIMTRSFLAQNYYQQEEANKQYTDKEIDDYYSENSGDFVTTSFRYLPFEFTATDETTKTEAQTKAESFLKEVTSEDDFLKVATKYVSESYAKYLNDQYTKISGLAKTDTNIPSDIREWLYTDGIKANDKKVFFNEEQGCYYAVLATGTPGKDETMLYSVRHILTKVESGSEETTTEAEDSETTTDSTSTTVAAEPTEKQWAECKEASEKIVAEFNKTDKSQLAFAELAEKYSDDTASTTEGESGLFGGLYAQVPAGKMVPEFENWATDSSRKYGDVELVKTEYGYHIMFFVSNQASWKYNVQSAIFEAGNKDMIAEIKNSKKSGFKKCTVAMATKAEDVSSTTPQ